MCSYCVKCGESIVTEKMDFICINHWQHFEQTLYQIYHFSVTAETALGSVGPNYWDRFLKQTTFNSKYNSEQVVSGDMSDLLQHVYEM